MSTQAPVSPVRSAPRLDHPVPWLAYVGCRTTRERQAQGKGLAVFRIGGAAWELVQQLEGQRNPSYLCLHPQAPVLYAVHGDFGEVSTWGVQADGTLELRDERGTGGRNPVHLALAPSGRWLLIANYATGNVTSLRVGPDGQLGAVACSLLLPGPPGPRAEQTGSHPHQVCFSPDGRLALVPDKGLDQVFSIRCDESTGHLRIAARSPMPTGSGPRHMVFHPRLPLVYIVGELDRTLLVAAYEPQTGAVQVQAAWPTVPPGAAPGSAAGIVLSSTAAQLFVSNRGHDGVATFTLTEASAPQAAGWLPTGRTPRFITADPQGKGIVVAHEDGHSIASLAAAADGLHELAQTGSPVCVVFRPATP